MEGTRLREGLHFIACKAAPTLFFSFVSFGFLTGCNQKEETNPHRALYYDFVKNFTNAEMLDVPLIIKFPSDLGALGSRVSHPAQHVDIAPTVLDLLGLPISQQMEGGSLLRFLRTKNGIGKSRKVFSYLFDARKAKSVIGGKWRFIQHWENEWDHQLYQRDRDPNEKINLFDENRV